MNRCMKLKRYLVYTGCINQYFHSTSHWRYLLCKLRPYNRYLSSFHRQHEIDDQAHEDLQPSITREGADEIQGDMHRMQELSVQASEELRKEEAMKIGLTNCYRSSMGSPVVPVVPHSSDPIRPGKKLLLELWRKELENREEENDEVEKEEKIAGVLEHESDEENANQKTRSINCIMYCQSGLPLLISNCEKHREKGIAMKEATVMQNRKLNMGRKRKANYQSSNYRMTIEYEAKETQVRGRTKKVKGQCSAGDIRYPKEQKQKRGRPKKVNDQVVDANICREEQEKNKGILKNATYQHVNENEYGEQKRKRGRPKKIQDQLVIKKECEGGQKRKRGRPKKINDHLVNNKYEGKAKPRRGRPKKVTNRLDDEKCEEKATERSTRPRKPNCPFIIS